MTDNLLPPPMVRELPTMWYHAPGNFYPSPPPPMRVVVFGTVGPIAFCARTGPDYRVETAESRELLALPIESLKWKEDRHAD